MRISQDVRDYAAAHGVDPEEALTIGMKEKAVEFVAKGGEVYATPPAIDR
jgi:phosphomethylpyrimidine synthase